MRKLPYDQDSRVHKNSSSSQLPMAKALEAILMVEHTSESNPAVIAVKDIIQSGELGQIYYLDAIHTNLSLLRSDTNVLWDLGTHDISILRYILGHDPIKVSAQGSVFVNAAYNLPEVVYILLAFAGNVIARVQLSWLYPVNQRRLMVVGSKKMLIYDDMVDDKVIIYDKGIDAFSNSMQNGGFRVSYRHGQERIYAINWQNLTKMEGRHFCNDDTNALKVLKILEMAQRSLNNKGAELLIEYHQEQ